MSRLYHSATSTYLDFRRKRGPEFLHFWITLTRHLTICDKQCRSTIGKTLLITTTCVKKLWVGLRSVTCLRLYHVMLWLVYGFYSYVWGNHLSKVYLVGDLWSHFWKRLTKVNGNVVHEDRGCNRLLIIGVCHLNCTTCPLPPWAFCVLWLECVWMQVAFKLSGHSRIVRCSILYICHLEWGWQPV